VRSEFARYVAAMFMLVLISSCGWGGTDDPRVAEVRAEVRIGMSPEQVVRMLDEKRIENSGYIEDQRVIRAIVRNVGGDVFVKKSQSMVFKFSSNRELETFDVKDVFTGP
jgi:hypothetical protein